MRWIIVLSVLSVAACGQMPESGIGESMALAQTTSTRWQGQDGKVLSAAQAEQAYRACQNRMFNPLRASAATITPLEDENFRLALTNPEIDAFGYSQVDSPTGAQRSGMN